jgi:hypothetical protein
MVRRFVYQGLWETVKECSINGAPLSFCLWELCEGNLEGGLLDWEL